MLQAAVGAGALGERILSHLLIDLVWGCGSMSACRSIGLDLDEGPDVAA